MIKSASMIMTMITIATEVTYAAAVAVIQTRIADAYEEIIP